MFRDAAKTRFYTTVKLGPNREKTPEGFLLCRNVAIARTGEQLYGRNSTPVEVGPDGFAVVSREADEVFRPETIASFNGKPVTNDHPAGDVTPANWSRLAKGVILHPRRGEGDESDLLMADVLIYDHELIELVLAGKDEVSCGYDADYVQTAVGRGKQVDIVGNHLAIVEAGRCGARCSIRDHAETGAGVKGNMAKQTRFSKFRDTVTKKFRDQGGDVEELKKALDSAEVAQEFQDAEEGETHVHVNLEGEPARSRFTDDELDQRFAAHEARLSALESKTADKEEDGEKPKTEDSKEDEKDKVSDADEEEFEKEAKEGTKDARKVRDSAAFDDSFQETVAMAEIIAPGIRIPTFDAAAKPKATLDAMCALRRKALKIASDTQTGSEVISTVRRGKQLTHDAIEGMTCSQTRDLFYQVGSAMKLMNVSQSRAGVRTVDAATELEAVGGSGVTPANFNKQAQEFWSRQRS